MSVANPLTGNFTQTPTEPVRRFSVAEYHKMIDSGFFADDEAFELLEGWIVPKMPRNAPHALAVALGNTEIGSRLLPEWVTRGQSGLTTSESEPEPDIAVVRGPHRRYKAEHPSPQDSAMMVEVSESTLRRDRTIKQRIFARARIPFTGL